MINCKEKHKSILAGRRRDDALKAARSSSLVHKSFENKETVCGAMHTAAVYALISGILGGCSCPCCHLPVQVSEGGILNPPAEDGGRDVRKFMNWHPLRRSS